VLHPEPPGLEADKRIQEHRPEAARKPAVGFDTLGVAADKLEEADTPVVVDRRVEEEPDRQAAVDKPVEGAGIAGEEPLPLSPQYHRLHKNGHYPLDYGRNRCKIETFFTSLAGFYSGVAIMAYRKDRFNGG